MPNEPAPVVVLFTPEFKRNLRQLAKKYRRIKTDVQPLLDTLEQGQTPGEQVPRVQYEVFKVRLRNSDSGKGKSGGYRVIYQRTADGKVVLITIYSKTEQEDIAPDEIRQIIIAHEAQLPAAAEVPPSELIVEESTSAETEAKPDSEQMPSD